MTPDTIHGKRFEKKLSDAFKPLVKKHPITLERIMDSAAAGNIIRASEADFRLMIKSKSTFRPYHFLIECKASVNHEVFNTGFRSLIKKGQLPLMRIASRAGSGCLYLFESLITNEVEVWDARQLYEAYYQKRVKFHGVPKYVVASANLPIFAARWVESPETFMREVLGES